MYTFVHEYNITSIEPGVKHQAQKTADALGLSLSAVVKALLKQFIRTKSLNVGITERPEIPNARTVQDLKQSEEDYKAGRAISFKTPDDALAYVSSLIEDDNKNKDTAH
jgi:antitoxin component of RelBE/YafQ-DinJ toxin-antitoxin module